MKRRSLRGLTLGCFLLTGAAMYLAGWFEMHEADLRQQRAAATAARSADDALTTEAGWRYRQLQARHWRHLMIQR